MTLTPDTQAVLQAMSALPEPDFSTLSAAQLRAAMGSSPYAPGDAVAAVEDREIAGPGGALRLRIYRPSGVADDAPLPATLYFHGGGFVIGTLDSHDNICRCLAQRAGCVVISVDYRLAPEAPFPAAVDDARAALSWLRAQAQDLGVDGARLAVAGDSAGGNLAAVLAAAPDEGATPLAHQLLLYPMTDCAGRSDSWQTYARGYFVTAEGMRWFIGHYLPDPAQREDPQASPLYRRDLTQAATATVFTAEYDTLRDEGEAYAQRLRDAGVAVTQRRWSGQIHGFASMLGVIAAAEAAMTEAASSLRAAFDVAIAVPVPSPKR